MARVLDVWYLNRKAGQLTQNDSGRLSFAYDADYLNAPEAYPISVSMPPLSEAYDERLARPYFSGLLPDESVRARLAQVLRVSERNPFSLLEIVGGECAGALSLYSAGETPHVENADDVRFLDDAHLDEIFREIKRRPLLAGDKGVRLSLAGAQDKIAVRAVGDKLALMLGGAPTTHIIKPLITGREDVKDSVHNELFCLRLAARVGLSSPHAEVRHTPKEPFLLIKRYDRTWEGDKVVRLHQEDFCQALSVSPETKYEREGGPNVARCLEAIQQFSIEPLQDRMTFLKIVIFNYLIGNADAHGKNFSFLHERGKPLLAPAYDLLSTAVYPELDSKMAMKLGGQYEPDKVFLRNWHKLVPDTATAQRNLEKTLSDMAANVSHEAAVLKADLKKEGISSPIFDSILAVIELRCGDVKG